MLKEFCDRELKQAPVIDNGKVIGIIEGIDFLCYMYSSGNPRIPVKEIMKKDFCKTYIDTPLDKIKNVDFDG